MRLGNGGSGGDCGTVLANGGGGGVGGSGGGSVSGVSGKIYSGRGLVRVGVMVSGRWCLSREIRIFKTFCF